jgi:hypothetical protein
MWMQYFIALEKVFQMVYSTPQSDLIWPLSFKGLVVGSQIPNLTPAPSFDQNSCKSSLNEKCEGNLSIYVLKPF